MGRWYSQLQNVLRTAVSFLSQSRHCIAMSPLPATAMPGLSAPRNSIHACVRVWVGVDVMTAACRYNAQRRFMYRAICALPPLAWGTRMARKGAPGVASGCSRTRRAERLPLLVAQCRKQFACLCDRQAAGPRTSVGVCSKGVSI